MGSWENLRQTAEFRKKYSKKMSLIHFNVNVGI